MSEEALTPGERSREMWDTMRAGNALADLISTIIERPSILDKCEDGISVFMLNEWKEKLQQRYEDLNTPGVIAHKGPIPVAWEEMEKDG